MISLKRAHFVGNVVLQFRELWDNAALSKGWEAERLDPREMKIPPENPSKDQVYRNKQEERRLGDRAWWNSMTANTMWTPLSVWIAV